MNDLYARISQSYCTSKPFYSTDNKDHCVDFSSPLGISCAKYPPLPNCITFTPQTYCQIRKPLWYETFCGSRVTCKQALPYLRDRSVINAPKAPISKKFSQSSHFYCFTKRQRMTRFRFLCTGQFHFTIIISFYVFNVCFDICFDIFFVFR